VLFCQEEAGMRRRIIEADLIDCVIGLGPNLFYNSPMEACIVICRAAKPKARKGKILFMNAVNEVTRERAQSFLTDDHIERIAGAYKACKNVVGFAQIGTIDDIRAQDFSLSIPLYVAPVTANGQKSAPEHAALKPALDDWLKSQQEMVHALGHILPDLKAPKLEGLRAQETCALLTDRSNWTRVRFGDVVDNLNETESNSAAAGLERFIGLEHLEPGSLHIRSWGNVADGTTFTRRCRPGQVLFGKRRAYQRKVAVAEFDAVVSGDIYVLAPKDNRLQPDVLPFICLSERFFEHAVGTSAGSLSPRTNWSSLANFEFDLPPVDKQDEIARILCGLDWTIQRQNTCCEQAITLMRAEQAKIFKGHIGHSGIQQFKIESVPDSWKLLTVADISKVVRGSSPRPKGDRRYYGGTVPRVMVADITRDQKYIIPSIDFLTEEGSKLSRPVPKGTLVLVCSGTPQQVGLPGILGVDSCIHDGIIGLTEIDAACRPEWLFQLFSFSQAFMDSAATHGGTFVNLTTDIVKGIQLGLPPLAAQDQHLARLSQIENLIQQSGVNLELQRLLLRALAGSIA
jgi:restriction endonuclease S subunit